MVAIGSEGPGPPAPDYVAIVRRMLTAAESGNFDEYLSYFDSVAEYKVGNADPVVGPKQIGELGANVGLGIRSMSHDIRNIWVVGDGVVLCQAVVIIRKDGEELRFPDMNIIRFQGDKIHKFQAFIRINM